MSDSVQPHRWQPTRLPCLWDSPGKNTGVGCHFLLQCMKVKSESEVAQSCPTLSDPMDCSSPGSSAHGIFQARVLELGDLISSISQVVARINNPHFSLCQDVVSFNCPECGCVFSFPLVPGTSPAALALGLRKQTSSGLHFL